MLSSITLPSDVLGFSFQDAGSLLTIGVGLSMQSKKNSMPMVSVSFLVCMSFLVIEVGIPFLINYISFVLTV